MAGEELLTISRDEHEQARLLSELKYELDMQSRMAAAKHEGRAEGEQRARQEFLKLLKSGVSAEEILHRYGGV